MIATSLISNHLYQAMNSKNYQIFETTIALPNVTWEQTYSGVEWQEAFDFFLRGDDNTWRLDYKLDSLNWHNTNLPRSRCGYCEEAICILDEGDQPSFQGQVSLRAISLNPNGAENDVLFRFFVGKGGILTNNGTIQLSSATTSTISTVISLHFNEPLTCTQIVVGVICDSSSVDYKPCNPLRSHVSEAFVDLLRCTNRSMGDTQFNVEGTIIGTQKARLAEKSDYFKTMLSRETQDAATTPIVIPDVTYENFAKVLAYIYSNQIEVPEFGSKKFRDLYAASVKYMLTDLTTILDQDIEQKITIHNVTSFLFEFAFRYEKHRKMLVSFFASNLSQIRQTDEFKKVMEKKSELEEYGELMMEILVSVPTK